MIDRDTLMRCRRAYPVVLAFVGVAACGSEHPTLPPNGGGGRLLPQSLLIWRNSTVVVNSRPAFDDKSVYFSGLHAVAALDKQSGVTKWTTQLLYPNGPPSLAGFGVLLAGGRLVVGDVDVFGLEPSTGAIVWRFAPESTIPNERAGFDRISSDGTTVYCGGVWGNVYAIDGASGKLRWIAHVTADTDSLIRVFSPTLADGVLYVGFGNDTPVSGQQSIVGGVAAIDATTGRLLWSTRFPQQPGNRNSDTREAAVTATRVLAGTYDGFLYGLDRRTGAIVDTIAATEFGLPTGTLTGSFVFSQRDTAVVVAVGPGPVVALDARDLHRVLWKTTFNRGSVVDVITDSTFAYLSYLGGQFAVLNLRDGTALWWIERIDFRPNGEEVTWAGAVDGNRVYVGASQDLYAFKRR